MKRGCLFFLLMTVACGQQAPPAAPAPPATASTGSVAPEAAPAPPPPTVSGPKLMPVDEALQDTQLFTYRSQLLNAVRSRDAKAFVALVDPKIRTSFGEGGGAKELEQLLPRKGVWEALDFVLSHGGTFREESFWAPYIYSAWPESIDAFESLAVTGGNVPLRSSKDPNVATVATLSYDIVTRGEQEGEVKTTQGKSGWVDPKHLWSPIGYRAGFNKVDGKWRMNAFVAGD